MCWPPPAYGVRLAQEKAAANPEIDMDYLYVDNTAMQACSRIPASLMLSLRSNLFGDILSDEAPLCPAHWVSCHPLPSVRVLRYNEPIHGSAPDIAGRGIANPLGTILSAAMTVSLFVERT